MASVELPVGGIEPLTTVDFPGRLAGVAFCQGCPWRCPYCHNPGLQPFCPKGKSVSGWRDVRGFLEERIGFLEGIVFSGGEPTAHMDLPRAMDEARSLGFAVGLHSAGIFPDRLASVLPFTDWLGLDIKAPFDERYDRLVGSPGAAEAVSQSLDHALAAGVKLQLRTTVDPRHLGQDEIEDITRELERRQAPPSVLQNARPAPGAPAGA